MPGDDRRVAEKTRAKMKKRKKERKKLRNEREDRMAKERENSSRHAASFFTVPAANRSLALVLRCFLPFVSRVLSLTYNFGSFSHKADKFFFLDRISTRTEATARMIDF